MALPALGIAPRTWRLLDTAPAAGTWNMALDEALADSVRAGGPPTLRLYRWDPPCLSLGRNQPARGRYDLAAIAARGIDVVRRPTGGRAVLHHRELTYCVAVPEGELGPPRQTYAAINGALVAGLRRLGVPATLERAGATRAPVPSLSPCFQEPTEGEVVALGRKLIGSAQRRAGGVILQHGSLLIEDDQSVVADFLREPRRDGGAEPGPPATLAVLLGRVPEWAELVGALAAGWEAEMHVFLEPDVPSAGELAAVRAGEVRFRDPAWTWHL